MITKLLEFDVKSLTGFLFWGNLALSALIFAYRFTHDIGEKKGRLIGYGLSRLVQTVAWLLLFLRGCIPDWLSVNTGNFLLILSFFLESGIMLAMLSSRKESSKKIQFGILILAVLSFNAAVLPVGSPNIRVAAASLAIFCVFVVPAARFIIESDDKDRFFSIISHDLRGPVGGVSMMLKEFLKRDNYSPENKKALLAELSRQADKTYILLEDLLEWSNIQLNTLKANFENVGLRDLVVVRSGQW